MCVAHLVADRDGIYKRAMCCQFLTLKTSMAPVPKQNINWNIKNVGVLLYSAM